MVHAEKWHTMDSRTLTIQAEQLVERLLAIHVDRHYPNRHSNPRLERVIKKASARVMRRTFAHARHYPPAPEHDQVAWQKWDDEFGWSREQ